MKKIAVSLLILLISSASHAQGYPQTYPSSTPQQQASVIPYVTDPYYAPNVGGSVAAQPQQPAQQAPTNEPRPGEYGRSVMTDIRQMNF